MKSGFVHDAFIYDDDSVYVDALVPFITEGRAREESVCIVTRTEKADLLREALGSDDPEITFIDAVEWYRKPVRTIAGYNELILDGVARGVPRLRVIGEVEFGETPIEHSEWTRYESMLNLAFADRPAWVVCPYDSRVLPEGVIDDALRTHPHAYFNPDSRSDSECFAHDHAFSCPVPALEETLLAHSVSSLDELSSVRDMVANAATEAGIVGDRVFEFVLVANELVTNAITHGGPPAMVRVGRTGSRAIVEVEDAFVSTLDAAIGFVPPTPTQEGGRGVWLARHFADRLEVVTRDGRTVAAAEFGAVDAG